DAASFDNHLIGMLGQELSAQVGNHALVIVALDRNKADAPSKKTSLVVSVTQGDQIRLYRYALRNLHSQQGFKRFEVSRLRNSQALQELSQRTFATNILRSRLGAHRSSARQDQHRTAGVQSSLQGDDCVILAHGLAGWAGQKTL